MDVASQSSNHHSFRLPPPGIERPPASSHESVSPSLKANLERAIKSAILTSESGTVIHLQSPRIATVLLRLQKFGDTAILAETLHQGTHQPECLTLCLGGMDRAEDESVLGAVGAIILGKDEQRLLKTAVAELLGSIRVRPRPLAVHLHLDNPSYDNFAVRFVTHSFAEAFFDQFGLANNVTALSLE